jgi:hypothetical protein
MKLGGTVQEHREIKNSILSGEGAPAWVLKEIGITQEDYDKWANLKKTGRYQDTKNFLDTYEKIDTSLFNFSEDEKKKDIEKYYNTYEQLTTIAS